MRGADGTLNSDNHGQTLRIVNGNLVTGDPRVMGNPEYQNTIYTAYLAWRRHHER